MSYVKVVGVPFNVGMRTETSHAMDQQNGPNAIRKAFKDLTRGYDVPVDFEDLGDIKADSTVAAVLQAVQTKVGAMLGKGEIPFLLGGDHTFTLGSLRALAERGKNFSLIYLDAHPDLMPHPEINYGSALFYAIKEGVVDPKRMAFLGIRQIELPEQAIIDQHNIFHIKAVDFEALTCPQIVTKILEVAPPPYYLSIDIDVISPCEAPGVGNPFPGGLSFRELLYVANEICKHDLVGLELVQLSPLSDRDGETAAIAATLLSELSTTIAKKARRH